MLWLKLTHVNKKNPCWTPNHYLNWKRLLGSGHYETNIFTWSKNQSPFKISIKYCWGINELKWSCWLFRCIAYQKYITINKKSKLLKIFFLWNRKGYITFLYLHIVSFTIIQIGALNLYQLCNIPLFFLSFFNNSTDCIDSLSIFQ